MHKKILWLVTARSGSKSIPHKNIKLLGGYPLLGYRIKSALASASNCDVWISTDSEDYAEIAVSFGAERPFLRPGELAGDAALSTDVVLHAMEFASKEGRTYDYIGLLEPTSPFVEPAALDAAIEKMDTNDKATAVVAVKESRPHKIFVQEDSMYLDTLAANLGSLKNLGRQAFKKEITPSGGFYISRWGDFLNTKTFYTATTLGYELEGMATLEIDEPIDWLFAEFVTENQLFKVQSLFDNGL